MKAILTLFYVDKRGDVTNDELKRIRQAGYTDGGTAEIIANVVINVFTNYFNKIAKTDIDFQKVSLGSRKRLKLLGEFERPSFFHGLSEDRKNFINHHGR